MSSVLMFDTLAFANKLKNAGVPSSQAEAQSEALAEVLSTVDQQLVTKGDLKTSHTELKAEINSVRTELKAEIEHVRTELKAEIEHVRTELKAEIQNLRTEVLSTLHTEISNLENRLLIKLGTALAASIGIMSAIMAVFHLAH